MAIKIKQDKMPRREAKKRTWQLTVGHSGVGQTGRGQEAQLDNLVG